MTAAGEMPSDYALALGSRLRAVRNRLGMSLSDVEERSLGRFKGVVVASYERADRQITAEKLTALAGWYGADAAEILTGIPARPAAGSLSVLRTVFAEMATWTDGELADLLARATLPAQPGLVVAS